MLQDAARGAPTEIDAICGAVARAGAQVGVATPLNTGLGRLVHQMESGAPTIKEGDVAGLVALLNAIER
jgi:2-dehydropantoate 2-reductase